MSTPSSFIARTSSVPVTALMAVGVASDEVARHGINQWKRNRLISAGADLIIGDYGHVDALMRELSLGG